MKNLFARLVKGPPRNGWLVAFSNIRIERMRIQILNVNSIVQNRKPCSPDLRCAINQLTAWQTSLQVYADILKRGDLLPHSKFTEGFLKLVKFLLRFS
jgi:hypothetical protein